MRRVSLAAGALLVFAACGSLGSLGDLGGILGSPSADRPSDVRGTVAAIDTAAQRIDLNVSYINNLRETRNNQPVYWTRDTRVEYQGQTYRPEDLERGDEISVRGHNNNGRYVAEVITVTRNVRS